jgi:hypothetical protein
MKSRKMMRWAGHATHTGEKGKVYMLLVGNSEGKRPLGGPRSRLEDNNRIDFGEREYGGVDRTGLAQDRDK